MEIAPDFTDAQWKALTFRSERDWIRAVSVLRRRLEARFLKPARSLRRQKRSGFAILALDSLLVETIEQFLQGQPETPRRSGEAYFTSFLTGRYFGSGFDANTAALFYTTIRCGILHQAEVKASSLVRRTGPVVTLAADGNGVTVNPLLFHDRMERATKAYLAALRNPRNHDLRQKFRDKMDYIARI